MRSCRATSSRCANSPSSWTSFIPGFGDAIGALLSAWIVIGALRHRVPLMHVVRMVANVLIDLTIGEIPIVGDLFDIAFEENVINMRLLLKYRDRSRPPRSFPSIAIASLVVVAIIATVSIGLIVVVLAAVFWITAQR